VRWRRASPTPDSAPNEPENAQALQLALTETRTLTPRTPIRPAVYDCALTLTSGFPNTYLLKNGIFATIPIAIM